MAITKYDFLLEENLVKANMHEWMAVRIVFNAKSKIINFFKKAIEKVKKTVETSKTLVNDLTAPIPVSPQTVQQIDNVIDRMQTNEQTIASIKQNIIDNKNITPADIAVLNVAQKENERYSKKLVAFGKKIELQDGLGKMSPNYINFYETKKQMNNVKVNESTPVGSVVTTNNETPSSPIASTINPEVIAPVPIAQAAPINQVGGAPTSAEQNLQQGAAVENKEVTNNAQPDLAIDDIVKSLNKVKELESQNRALIADNERLTAEGKLKDEQIANLTTEKGNISNENKTLNEQVGKQGSMIATLNRELETLRADVQNKKEIEEKIATYDGIIAAHEKERLDMTKELEQLRLSANDNKARIDGLLADVDRLTGERDYYKNKILDLHSTLNKLIPTQENVIPQPSATAEETTRTM